MEELRKQWQQEASQQSATAEVSIAVSAPDVAPGPVWQASVQESAKVHPDAGASVASKSVRNHIALMVAPLVERSRKKATLPDDPSPRYAKSDVFSMVTLCQQ